MGATEDTANNGGEKKIVVKDEGKGGKGGGRGYFIPHHSGRGNSDKSPKKEKFQGACTDLIDHVFEAGANCSAQIATYTTSTEAIKTTWASTTTHMCYNPSRKWKTLLQRNQN